MYILTHRNAVLCSLMGQDGVPPLVITSRNTSPSYTENCFVFQKADDATLRLESRSHFSCESSIITMSKVCVSMNSKLVEGEQGSSGVFLSHDVPFPWLNLRSAEFKEQSLTCTSYIHILFVTAIITQSSCKAQSSHNFCQLSYAANLSSFSMSDAADDTLPGMPITLTSNPCSSRY